MQLNVNLISHPIIKKLSNQIRSSTYNSYQITNTNYELYNLLIYEITRKWIKSHNIYIQNIDSIKNICIFDTQESYLIITNFLNCGNMLNTINTILPKVHLQHINLDKHTKTKITDDYLDDKIIPLITAQKIIIIENFLTNYSIVQLLDYLLIDKQILINNIKIICITCNSSILEYMGNKYKFLQIYTTQINYY